MTEFIWGVTVGFVIWLGIDTVRPFIIRQRSKRALGDYEIWIDPAPNGRPLRNPELFTMYKVRFTKKDGFLQIPFPVMMPKVLEQYIKENR